MEKWSEMMAKNPEKSEGVNKFRIHVRDIYDKPAVVINDIMEKMRRFEESELGRRRFSEYH